MADRWSYPAQVDVRADPADDDLVDRLATAIGFRLPVQPNTVAGDQLRRHALWLGPAEWLVVGPPGTEHEIEEAIRGSFSGAFGAVVDVSANRRVVELAGPEARETLEAGCSIDLHPRSFGPGRCAQTIVARANVILHQVNDEPRYRLYVQPSFFHYLEVWLVDASRGSTKP